MTEAEEYMEYVQVAKENLDAAIAILERHGLEYNIELKKRLLYIDMTSMRYKLEQKQVSLGGWLKGVFGFGK